MKTRWIGPFSVLLIVTACVRSQTPMVERAHVPLSVGSLVTVSATADALPARPVPYEPRPGDIVLYDDFNKFYHLVFKLANTAPPTHAAMIIDGPNGTPALLELTGPQMIFAKVTIMDVEPRFKSYPGTIMIRRIRTPLTAEQSHELTHFAEEQSGKRFALGRVMLQATPFCPRTGLRKQLFGKTYATRDRWFCSEMVVAACASAHVLDGKVHLANGILPRDLAYDETIDLSGSYHPAMTWNAELAPTRQGAN